ncbi:MAG: M23 family metallopeptidase [Candidatus Limimorpha sp.]
MGKSKWFEKIKRKFKVIIIHPETYEERGSFKTSRLILTVVFVSYTVFLIAGTACLVVFTPLRELIPGYTDVSLNRRVYNMECHADSLDEAFRQNELYIENLKRIIYEEDFFDDSIKALSGKTESIGGVVKNGNVRSSNDSMFRAHFEAEVQYNLFNSTFIDSDDNLNMPTFFVPLNGLVTNHFNRNEKHYGTDLVANSDAVINATADGTVVFSDWSVNMGYVIAIQHFNNLISIYKHNAALLRQEGDYVKAGDAISIIGGSGSISTGPHLHFELWYNGRPLNPEDYISFEVK